MNETTQQTIVQALRTRILSGELAPGQRLVEAQLAERLGISRTPLRYALSVLATEGLVERSGARGYIVRRFSVTDVLNGIDVRGVLEGLAARSVAERGVNPTLARALQECLREGDAIFQPGAYALNEDAETRYADMNGRFHALIVEAAQNHAVSAALGLNDKIPFVSPATVVFDDAAREQQVMMLAYAHRQHHAIVGALLKGEGARVEALMKEHTHISKESLNLSVDHLHLIVGAA
ncbi:GntR family transcriptional regulator of vanillate catabolism [Paraburkholderia bannensis]|jgi:GntR family transcriptional regulator of vanillate catabolism|uniref:GntR family transcriptional regulator of vanillate catabolism n=1 Tax=Paraburkholderia bannensis TaxID=765414 RepID=A0A7W9TXJ6_9BURK|nr:MULTISPECIES: GntR family transcriptional regulator [Paraburkholderia]MBB3257434.1 GntR family transcriptional regulator of vanillate catabolism [Paraburkholderia sp. WP4_3_2]MBB6102170.1 GntR family transcriptional regulator of vanillate catabolism [Paraburkholderia bannensis]